MLYNVAPKKFIQLNLFVSIALVLSGILLNANVWDLKCQIQSSLYCFRLSFWLADAHQSRKYCRDVRSVWVALMMFSSLADVAKKGPSVLHHQLLSQYSLSGKSEHSHMHMAHIFLSLLPLELAWHDCTYTVFLCFSCVVELSYSSYIAQWFASTCVSVCCCSVKCLSSGCYQIKCSSSQGFGDGTMSNSSMNFPQQGNMTLQSSLFR